LRLTRLKVERLPGISERFELDGLAAGVNVVVGPNASGKSSVVRALRATLYSEEPASAATDIEGAFDTGSGELIARRTGKTLQWEHAGEPVAAPTLPDHRFLGCFTLGVEELLDGEGATDDAIAERLSQALAGGYDIGAARERVFPVRSYPRKLGNSLDEARRQRREHEKARERLRDEEARLERLESERRAAVEAQAEGRVAEAAARLLAVRQQRYGLEQQLAEYADGMARLRGDEADELTRLNQRLASLSDELAQARRRHDEAVRRQAETGLSQGRLDAATVSEQRQRIERLRSVETQLSARWDERDGAYARWADAVSGLGGEPDAIPQTDPATLERVSEMVGPKREVEAAIETLNQALTRLPSGNRAEPDPETLAAGRSALTDWLRASDSAPGFWWRRALIAAGALAGLGGIVAAAVGLRWEWALLLLPWLGVSGYLVGTGDGGGRDDARRRYQRLGLAAPEAWTVEAVGHRLHELDQELRTANDRYARLQRRYDVEQDLAAQRARHQSVMDELQALAREVGFDPARADVAFDRWLRLIHTYDQARQELARVDEAIRRLTNEAAELRRGLTDWLAEFDQAPTEAEPNADALSAHLEALSQRLDRFEQARRDAGEAERHVEQLVADCSETERGVGSLYELADVAVGDETTLRQRLEWLSDWQRLTKDLADARARERERDQELGDAPQWRQLVEAEDAAEIERRQADLADEARRRDDIVREIERINGEIRRAGDERWLERARAEEQAAEEELSERLDEALFSETGRYLLEQVEAEHTRSSQPPALERASAQFAALTHQGYRLAFDPRRQPAFRAWETTTGTWRELSELSSGTRMQLLIAVRIAFAMEVERGAETLPLVLDEALTTADPERFRAAVTSLRQLAEEGRQIFYLTAQPSDLAHWREEDPDAHWLDLAELRRQGVAISAADVALEDARDVPAPGDETAAAYAARIGVPELNPWADAASVHSFYLLRDDLDLLHRLLELRLDRVGTVESFLDSRTAGQVLTENEQQRLRRRASAVRAWLAAWRVGRGYPVDREALAASQALSDTYFERVAEVNDRVGGDAQRLTEALASGAVKGLLTRYRENLDEWLALHGYRDEREPLNEPQILAQMVAACLRHVPDRDTAIGEARFVRDSLAAAVGNEVLQPSL